MIRKIQDYTYARATVPYGNEGMLEVVVRGESRKPAGFHPGALAETEVGDYGNVGRWYAESQLVFHRDRSDRGRYTVRQLSHYPNPDKAWVVSAADGAVAACPMETAPVRPGYMGEREEAERWAAHLNDLFATADAEASA